MIYLSFPYGSNFGWGVLGKEIAFAMARQTGVRILAPPKVDQRLDDEFEFFQFRKMLAPVATGQALDGPVIQAVIGPKLAPFVPGCAPPAALGYAVFEESVLAASAIEKAKKEYRRLAVASGFCAEILEKHGLFDVAVVPHGVDSVFFCPRTEPRTFLADQFIVFSGGKFEIRKGQDIVIRAYKVLQDRHPDVMLVNSWHNSWASSRDTMAISPFIRYQPQGKRDFVAWMNGLLAAHGIDVERVITVGPRDHRLLPSLYHATDLGLFPNRAEGGNNMVLMEYLACGKPAIVSYNTGHKDIARRNNAVLIETHRPGKKGPSSEPGRQWPDPSLEETIDKLEWCYQHRESLAPLGRQAAEDMRRFTWERLTNSLLQLL